MFFSPSGEVERGNMDRQQTAGLPAFTSLKTNPLFTPLPSLLPRAFNKTLPAVQSPFAAPSLNDSPPPTALSMLHVVGWAAQAAAL